MAKLGIEKKEYASVTVTVAHNGGEPSTSVHYPVVTFHEVERVSDYSSVPVIDSFVATSALLDQPKMIHTFEIHKDANGVEARILEHDKMPTKLELLYPAFTKKELYEMATEYLTSLSIATSGVS